MGKDGWSGQLQTVNREQGQGDMLTVERPEKGLHLDRGAGYEVDKPRGAEDGKQYNLAIDTRTWAEAEEDHRLDRQDGVRV